eukprot:3444975-Pleurochrysis_carterae.AAC.2
MFRTNDTLGSEFRGYHDIFVLHLSAIAFSSTSEGEMLVCGSERAPKGRFSDASSSLQGSCLPQLLVSSRVGWRAQQGSASSSLQVRSAISSSMNGSGWQKETARADFGCGAVRADFGCGGGWGPWAGIRVSGRSHEYSNRSCVC